MEPGVCSDADQSGLARQCTWTGRLTRANSALLTMRCAHTAVARNSFKHHDKLFFETGRKTSRNSAQRRRSPSSNRPASLLPLHRRRTSAGHLNPSGDLSMSKRIALLSAAAFGALALTATLVAPVSAQEKTVMVGGAAMFPSKNIIQNAVHSKDHTTLVAAVKAAGRYGRHAGEAREQADSDKDPDLSCRAGQTRSFRPDRWQEAQDR